MKYWRLSYNDILWSMSYQNVIMLNMSIPQFDDKGNKIEAPSQVTGKDLSSRFKKKE